MKLSVGGRKREWSWEVFVASMFVGLGIGMFFDAAGEGVVVGMGIGFILGALIKVEKARVELRPPRGLLAAALTAIGVIFIGLGLGMLGLLTQQALRYLGGVAFIALGALTIGASAWILRKK